MARRVQKRPGMMLYFEDYSALRSSLNTDELVSVLDAITAFSESSHLPDENTFSPAALICWRFMRPKIERDILNYQEICTKRSAAAKASRSAFAASAANAANAAGATSAANPTEPNPTEPNSTAAETKMAADDSELLSQIADYQRADDLVQRYQLPDGDTSREALLEDAERIGWPKLEEALQAASRSNSRQRLSINFYRRFLNDAPFRKEASSFADFGFEQF